MQTRQTPHLTLTRDSRIETLHIQSDTRHGALTTFSRRIGYVTSNSCLSSRRANGFPSPAGHYAHGDCLSCGDGDGNGGASPAPRGPRITRCKDFYAMKVLQTLMGIPRALLNLSSRHDAHPFPSGSLCSSNASAERISCPHHGCTQKR